MSRLLKRAALVGLGGYVVAVLFAGYAAVRHPESYIHFTPLQGFGIELVLKTSLFLEITVGAALALTVFRSRTFQLSAAWLLACGALVILLARLLPNFAPIAEACPTGEVCNPYDWSQLLEWVRILLLAFTLTAVLAVINRPRATHQ